MHTNNKLYSTFAGSMQSDKMTPPPVSVWDRLAEEYAFRLQKGGVFGRALTERADKTVKWLKQRGAIGKDSRILDIGCGPGIFESAFSKEAKEVTGIDISPRMLDMAKENNAGLENVRFINMDFHNADIDELQGPYDLVFSSITPAAAGMKNIDKMMSLSRKWCYSCLFVHWYDGLEQAISEKLYNIPYAPSHGKHDKIFYSLFNILWLRGYYPEVSYIDQNTSDMPVPGKGLARQYARIFTSPGKDESKETEKILQFMERLSDNGELIRNASFSYGQILWDVTKTTERPDYFQIGGQE